MFLKTLRFAGSRFAALVAVIVLLASAQEAMGQLQVRFEQAGFPSKTVTDNGPEDQLPEVGRLRFTGAYGTFTANLTTGMSKPIVGNGSTEARIDLNSIDVSASSGGTLIITAVDTGFTFPQQELEMIAQASGSLSGQPTGSPIPPGTSVTFYSWTNAANISPLSVDPSVIPGGSTQAGPLGPYSTATFAEHSPFIPWVRGVGPYSIFNQTVITMGGAARASVGLATRVKGVACTGAIGDFVWNDVNQNGIQDSGELGIPGVTVQLFINGDNTTPFATTTTDVNGVYMFNGLCANTYTVVVPSQAALTGYQASPTFVGGNPAADSNSNPYTVTLATDASTDITIDFGYFVPNPQLRVVKTPDMGAFSPGGQASFNIVVSNPGGSPANNVHLSDQLPAAGGLTWMTASTTQGNCLLSGSQLECELLTIPAGGSVTVTVTSTPQTPASACQFQLNARAIATSGNLTAEDSGSLNCAGTVLTTSTPSLTVVSGTSVTLTVTETNVGGSTITGVSVTGTGCSTWTGGATILGPGASTQFQCTFTPTTTTNWTAQGHGTDTTGNPVPDTNESTGGVVTVVQPPSATCVEIVAFAGTPITPVTMTGTGGTGGPYTFSATGLPAGLTMSSTGTISGTPSVTGAFTYTVTVTDNAGHSGSVNCSITVIPPPSAACIAITAIEGVPITPVTMTGTGGVGGPYTFSATGLPTGLTMSSTGTISGTSTVSGTFTYTVTVTDSAGNTGTLNCSVTVTPPGRITIRKVTDPSTDTTTTFSFTTTGAGYSSFTLKNGQSNTATLQAGSYSVTEGSLANWNLRSISCTTTGGASTSVSGSRVNVSLTPGGTASCTVTNAQVGLYCSYTPGGWGAPPNGGNIATKLYTYFGAVYPNGVVMGLPGVSGRYKLTLTSASAVTTFLPSGGTPGVLNKDYKNPTSTSAGEFASQVSALKFNVDFSNAGAIKPGFSSRVVTTGPLAGLTITQVLSLANNALGGNTSVLGPYGITVAQFTSILSSVNENYDNCTTNKGYLR